MFMAAQPVMALLLLLLLQPVMAHFYLCWWRLRVWEGSMYFVHPGGWYDLLGQWQVDCLDVLFQEEPEMAAYVVGMGQLNLQGGEISWWPPTWHTESQQWLISRFPPARQHVHVAARCRLE